MPDYGSSPAVTFTPAATFTPTTHSHPTAALNPKTTTLPNNFTVCIIGASRGIGASIATSYALASATNLVLAARRLSGLEAVAAECKRGRPGINIEVVECDITSAEDVSALAERSRNVFGRLDVAVVNSGYSGPVALKVTETDPETFARATGTNYVGTFLCAKYLIPLLLSSKDGARAFIGVGSLAAMIVRELIANAQYCVSKTAQLKLMEHVHEQFCGEGLKAFTVHPGAVLSEMAEETAPEEFKQYLTDSPELCGSFCVWLTKGEKAWLSGRFVSANWDVDELEARREEIVEKDLLKLKLMVQ